MAVHPVKILSDPLGGKEFAEARERRNKSRGPENGETNPLTTFDYVIRTHGRDRSCVRSIHRIALLPPPPPPPSLPPPRRFVWKPIGGRYRHKPVQIIRVSLARMSGADRPESIQIEKSGESGGGGEKFDSLVIRCRANFNINDKWLFKSFFRKFFFFEWKRISENDGLRRRGGEGTKIWILNLAKLSVIDFTKVTLLIEYN